MGSLCSVLLLALVILYSYQKADILINKKDVDILSTVNEDFYSSDDTWSSKNGFNIAAAFSAYDSETEWILDPTYGSLVFNHFSWGIDENGDPFTKRQRLDEHSCTSEELGLDETDRSDAQFLPIRDLSLVKLYQKKFICA